MSAYLRPALAAAIVWYALGMPGLPVTPGGGGAAPYAGTLSALHTASRSMESKDKEGLSEALSAVAAMIRDDRLDAIKTTSDIQRMIETGLDFGYSTFQVKKYPAVGQAVQDEISKAVGTQEGTADAAIKAKVAGVIEEAARAVR